MDSVLIKDPNDLVELDHFIPGEDKNLEHNGGNSTNGDVKGEKEVVDVEIEEGACKPLIYRINQVPPIHMVIMFAFQQVLLVISSPLSLTLIASEITCAQEDNWVKLHILSANFFMVGLATFCMTTFGVRLPIFQGASTSYLIPLMAMTELEEWKCLPQFEGLDPVTNQTILMSRVDNVTVIPAREIALGKLGVVSGSLMAAGLLHSLIGLTGFVGVLCRYIGPVTIVPTIVLVGLNIYKYVIKFSQPNMGIAMVVVFFNILLSLVLKEKQTPVPWWNRQKGFHVFWFPVHQVFSILISLLIGWMLCGIFTVTDIIPNDPDNKQYLARTDSRSEILEQTDWLILPYPGKLGPFGFSVGVFMNFFIASLMSVLDSIGDYAAAARMARVTPPPAYAFNRGISVEGILSFLSGTMGCCSATVSYGTNIGAMGITRVVSRRVFQAVGVIFILFSVVGKLGAFFITIPYPVLGGTTLITVGIFLGLVLSYLQSIDLSSTRNVAIIGIALLLGQVLPNWLPKNIEDVTTGIRSLDIIFQMLLSNPAFIGGVFSCTLDNIVPGTLRERGLHELLNDLNDMEAKERAKKFEDGPEVYRMPYIPEWFRRSKIAKWLPLFDREEEAAKQ